MALSRNPADWTVDKLLSVLQGIDTRTADVIEARYAARDQWQRMVHDAAQIPDAATRAQVQAQLVAWRHRDLVNAQRLKDFDAKLYQAKQLVKAFLVKIHHAVPDYLGAAPLAVLIPATILAAIIAADVGLVLLNRGNDVQRQGLGAISNVLADASSTSAQKLALIREINKGAELKDPIGLTSAMQAALPLALLAAAVYLAPLFLRKRSAA